MIFLQEKPTQPVRIFCDTCGYFLTPIDANQNNWLQPGAVRACVFCDNLSTDDRIQTMANSAMLFQKLMRGNQPVVDATGIQYKFFYLWAQQFLACGNRINSNKLNQMILNNVVIVDKKDQMILDVLKLACRHKYEFAVAMGLVHLVQLGIEPIYIKRFVDIVCDGMFDELSFSVENSI